MRTAFKKIYSSPEDQELMECLIKATCMYFNITEEDFLTGATMDISNMRQICIYLIMNNSSLKPLFVAQRFRITRTVINYSISMIEVQKKIYRQTLNTITSVTEIANNLDKKFQWHIQ